MGAPKGVPTYPLLKKGDCDMYDPVKFFDEMNILRSEKKERLELSKRIKKSMDEFFAKQLLDIILGSFLHAITSQQYRDELLDLYVAMAGAAMDDIAQDREVIAKAERFAKYIEDTTEKNIQAIKGNSRFELSRQIGTMMAETDIPSEINRLFSSERALEIALNETNWIYNYIQHQNLVASGQLTHTWLSQEDERVRPTHVVADGQTVPINQPFIVGGYQLLFPGDDSLGAPVNETILCRCVEV